MAEWMDRDCKVWPALQPAGKVRSFTPRGRAARVVFNPLALHFARRPPPPLPRRFPPASLRTYLELVLLLPVAPGQKNRALFDCIFTLTARPPAWCLVGRVDGVHRDAERLPEGSSTRTFLIQDFPEIKMCISFHALMRSLHCYRGKICIGSLCL